MLSTKAVQLRIALALVLLEHQPAGLALHDYLKALRNEVKKRRSGGEVEEESVTSEDAEGSIEDEEEQREEPERHTEAEEPEKVEQVEELEEVEQVEAVEPVPEVSPEERLRLAASSLGDTVEQAVQRLLQRQTSSDPSLPSQFTSHAPSPSPRPISGYIGAVLDALEGVVQSEEGESVNGGVGLGWEELGTVFEWILPQVASVPEKEKRSEGEEGKDTGRMKTRGKKRKEKGSAAHDVEERTKEELVEQLTHLLLRLATPAFDASPALSVFASLLIRFTSFFPLGTLSRFLPFFLDQLASLLPPLMRTSEVEDCTLHRLAPLVSLLHLTFNALPPPKALQLFLIGHADDVRPLRLSLERLTHLLTSTATSLDPDTLSLRFLPVTGDGASVMTVEEAVLGVLERCWEFRELEEREERGEEAVEGGD